MRIAIDESEFVAATRKLVEELGQGERLNREFAQLVFGQFGPEGYRFDQVAMRVVVLSGDTIGAEMFVLGGGLLTIVVKGEHMGLNVDEEIDELEFAPDWVSAGDRYFARDH